MRRFLLWSFFLVALGVLSVLVILARRSIDETPRAALEAALRAGFGPDRDPELAFRHLQFALRGAEAEKDRDLVIEILKARARLYTAVGSLARARVDFEEVLALHRPDDLESQLALSWILIQLQELEGAMELVDAVLAVDPGSARALAYRGQILLGRAEEDLRQAAETLVVLPQAERAGALRASNEASALLPSDPLRIRIVQQLRQPFPLAEGNALSALLERLESATDRIRAARETLVAGFQGQATSETLSAYFRLLDRAGRSGPTLDFALTAASHPGMPADPGFLRRVMQLLLARRQPHLAAEFAARHLAGNVPTPEFYRLWCQALWADERFDDLIGVAKALYQAGDTADRSIAMAYVGLAAARLGRFEDVERVLRPYLLQQPREPFPGALALAWSDLARAFRAAERPIEEAGALRSALDRDSTALEGEGELWLRLVELEEADPSPSKDRLEMERHLTEAIARLPRRVEELMPLWNDLGNRNMEAARIDLSLLIEELEQENELTPRGPAGPFQLYQLALAFASRKLPSRVIRNCERLLAEFPGFLPAIDRCSEAYLALGNLGDTTAARLLIERVRLAGPDPRTLARLSALRPAALDQRQLLELMRLDPRTTARRAALAHLEKSGSEAAAVRGLLALGAEESGDFERLLAAELLVALGRAGEVEDALRGLSEDQPSQLRATALRLRAALELYDLERFEALLAGLSEGTPLDGPGLLALIDQLLLRGETARALELAQGLDSAPGPSSGRGLLRLAQARLLSSEPAAAEECLARAEAFLEDGSAEVGYVVRTVEDRDWGVLPVRTGDVRVSPLGQSPLVLAILDLLAEQHEAASARIAQEHARQPEERLWILLAAIHAALAGGEPDSGLPGWSEDTDAELRGALRGADGVDRDPRGLLVRVLALLHPEWIAWAIADLGRMPLESPGGLWPSYLAGRGLLRLGEAQRAGASAEAILQRFPNFLPAWDLLEQAEQRMAERAAGEGGLAPAAPDEVSRVRWREREILGAMPDAAVEAWMAALAAERQGDLGLGRRAIQRALDSDPDDLRFRLTQIRLAAADRDWTLALVVMTQALERAPALADSPLVPRAFELQRAALLDAPSPALRADVDTQRELLRSRFRTDPMVALEMARLYIEDDPAGAEAGLDEALSRLSAFRQGSGGVPLEDLRRGATRAWFDFYRTYDPSLAGSFVLSELEARPGSIELRRMAAEAALTAGHPHFAAAQSQQLIEILPFAEDARARVHALSELGADPEGFQQALERAQDLSGLAEPDLDLTLCRARFLLAAGPSSWDDAVALLAPLWDRIAPGVPEAHEEGGQPAGPQDGQSEPADESLRAERASVGRLYAIALCWRGGAEDLERARSVLPVIARECDDAYERNLFAALEAVAGLLDRQEP